MKQNQFGRSMIEMLGVLAIIGVLSVGGLAGYAKAMFKYRINATIEQISHIAINIQNAYADQRTYAGLNSMTPEGLQIIKKAKLVPENMIDETSTLKDTDINRTAWILNKFGGGVYIVDDTWGDGNYKGFTINYFNLPEDACIELATQDWTGLPGLKTLSVINYTYADTIGETTSCRNGKGEFESSHVFIRACPGGSVVPIPIPLSLAIQTCNCPNKTCDILFGFQ